MAVIENQQFDEERALYGTKKTTIRKCIISGSFSFMESQDIAIEESVFSGKYPLWHITNAMITNNSIEKDCFSPIWNAKNVIITKTSIVGPNALRECRQVVLKESDVQSDRALVKCQDLKIENCKITSENSFFDSKNITLSSVILSGQEAFQYVDNMNIVHSVIHSDSSLWHSNNIVLTDCEIKGDCIFWYCENVRLVRCKIIGSRPFCHSNKVYLEDCIMENSDLAFEGSVIYATVKGNIKEIFNPIGGIIQCDSIDKLIQNESYCRPEYTTINCENIKKRIN